MDLLKLLKDKAEYFSDSEKNIGISSVVKHIEAAERHYENGKLGDDYLFNDSIYRCNQAFEGVLKEAYRIITGKDHNKITPYNIEKYFAVNNILKERVLQLFTNYRTEWRNKSTHEYKLYFSEQEAFLGIINILAFINILFDQMVEKRAYDKEDAELKKSVVSRNTREKDKPILDRVTKLLYSYSEEIPKRVSGATIPRISEAELIGSLTAFLNNLAEDINVHSDFIISGQDSRNYYADLFLQQEEEKLIIEIKNPTRGLSRVIDNATNQLFSYLTMSSITNGILYVPPIDKPKELEIREIIRNIGGIVYRIVQIYPKLDNKTINNS